MRGLTAVVACQFWLVPIVIGGAHAQTPFVSTSVEPCVAVDIEAFQRLLDIELGTSVHVATSDTGAGRDTHVALRCVADGVELHLRDAITRKTMTRVLSSTSLLADSARLLALAVAEFVVASWIELAVVPEPAVEPVGPAPPPATLGAARHLATRRSLSQSGALRLGVVLSVSSWLAEERPMVLGPGVRLSQRMAAPLFWQLGADFSVGSTSLEQGRVDFGGTTFFGLLGLSGIADFWEASFGLGLRGGYLRTAGIPERGMRVSGALESGPIGGPLILTTVLANIGAVARLGLELEAGYPFWPLRVTSGETVVVGFDGPWLRGGLLVGVEF